MSSLVPQADLQPGREQVYMPAGEKVLLLQEKERQGQDMQEYTRWSEGALGLMYSEMYSSPMAGSPHSFSLS